MAPGGRDVVCRDEVRGDGVRERIPYFTEKRCLTSFSDQNRDKGEKSILFKTALSKSGKYEVRLAYASNTNRATQVPVTIKHAKGESTVTVTVNQQTPAPHSGLSITLGTFEFGLDEEVSDILTWGSEIRGVWWRVWHRDEPGLGLQRLSRTRTSRRTRTIFKHSSVHPLSLGVRLSEPCAAKPRTA